MGGAGGLQAMALRAAVALAEDTEPPEWLQETVREAVFDERAPVVQADWFATGIRFWSDDGSGKLDQVRGYACRAGA